MVVGRAHGAVAAGSLHVEAAEEVAVARARRGHGHRVVRARDDVRVAGRVVARGEVLHGVGGLAAGLLPRVRRTAAVAVAVHARGLGQRGTVVRVARVARHVRLVGLQFVGERAAVVAEVAAVLLRQPLPAALGYARDLVDQRLEVAQRLGRYVLARRSF